MLSLNDAKSLFNIIKGYINKERDLDKILSYLALQGIKIEINDYYPQNPLFFLSYTFNEGECVEKKIMVNKKCKQIYFSDPFGKNKECKTYDEMLLFFIENIDRIR